MCAAANGFEELGAMTDYIWTGLIAALLLAYLLYALLRPERF
jgi:K+-transporting ATPase KdpF subunit